jgi:ferric-dicitrate binding protein FerR (iron transport regulator)
MKWLHRLRRSFLLRRRSVEDDHLLNRVLARDAMWLRSVDPETHLQWLRLQRSLVERGSVRVPARQQRVLRWASGIGLTAAAVVGVYIMLAPNADQKTETFVTERGQQARVALQEESEALLNAATRLEVQPRQPGEPRRVSLDGEAFFRVRPNGTPFVVSTRWADVQVVGTEFNVRARGAALEVAVIHGSVKVSARGNTLTLAQHQIAVCSEEGVPQLAGTIPSPEYPGWLSGKLFLRQTPFDAACRELELRFDISIRVEDAAVRTTRINGVLDARTPQVALASLSGLIQKNFRFDGTTYVID